MAEQYSVLVGIDSSLAAKGAREFDAASKKVQNSSKGLEAQNKKTKASMVGIGNAAYRLQRALGVIGVTGFAAAMASATREAIAFEGAMAEVATLIDDSFDPQKQLNGAVKELSATYGQAPINQARALYQVISAGAKDAADAQNTLEAANKLAVGGITDVATAADGLTSILNAYGLSGENATDVSDAMFVAMRAGKTTIGELSAAVGQLAPLTAATGVSIEEMLGATAALTKGGLSTSTAMAGLRAALSNIVKVTPQAANVAEGLGLEFNAQALEAKGLTQFMMDLQEATGGNSAVLAQLFGSVEAVNAIMALTSESGGAALLDIMEGMDSKAGETQTALDKVTASAQQQSAILRSKLQVAWIELGQQGLTVVAPALKAINDNFDQLIGIAKTATAILGGYLVIVKGLPKAYAAAAAAQKIFSGGLTLVATRAQGALVSVVALRTAFMTLGGVVNTAFAAFAGFQIGKLMFEQSATVRIAAQVVIAQFHKIGLGVAQMWEQVKILAQIGMAKFKEIVVLKAAEVVDFLASVFDQIPGAGEIAEGLMNTAEGMRGVTADTQELRDRLAETTAEFDRQRAAIDAQTEDYIAYEQRLQGAATAADGMATVLEKVEDAADGAGAAVAAATSTLPALESIGKAALKDWERLQDAIDPVAAATKRYESNLALLRKVAATQEGQALDLAAAEAKLLELYKEEVDAINGVVSSSDDLEAARRRGKKDLDLLRAGENAVQRAIVEHTYAVDELRRTQEFKTLSDEEQLEYLRLLEQEHRKNIEALEDSCDAAKKVVECQGEAAERLQTLWKRGLENIQDAFGNAFKNLLTGAESSFDGILDAFKDMVAQILATWAASGIMNLLSGQAFGAGGNSLMTLFSSVGGGGIAGGSARGATSQLGNSIGTAITGSQAFQSFAAAASAFGQGALAFFTGGGTAGATASGAVTSMPSVFNTGAQNAALQNPFAFNAGRAVSGAGLGALTGAITDSIFGGRGDPTRNAIFSGIGGAIGSIWGPIGSVVGGAIGSFVDNLLGGAKKLEKATLQLEFESEQFSASIEKVVSKQRSFFRGKKRTTTVDDISNEFSELEMLVGEFISGLEASAEALGSSNLEGFLNDFSFSRNINIKGLSEERGQAAIEGFVNDLLIGISGEFVDALEAGGSSQFITDTLRLFSDGLVEGIVEEVEEGIEQASNAADLSSLADAGGLFGGLISRVIAQNATLQSTGDSARKGTADVESFGRALQAVAAIAGLLDADLQQLATDAFQQQNMSATDTYNATLEAYQAVVEAYDGSLTSLEELAAATQTVVGVQATLIAAYQEVGRQVEKMFGDTRQSIAEALLSEEELYDLRQSQVDALVDQLNTATDPGEIARISQEIDRLTQQAFNLLDESQQVELQSGFLDFLDEVTALAQERIAEGIAGVESEQQDVRNNVSAELIATAAEIQAEAANEFRRGVDEMIDGWRRFGGFGGTGERVRDELVP